MRSYDGKTVLQNVIHDAQKRFENNESPKEIFLMLKERVEFLSIEKDYMKIRW